MADVDSSVPIDPTVKAARGLFEAVTQLGTAAVVVSAVSFYLGSRILESRFAELGAGWYAKTLQFEQRAQAGVPLVAGFFALSILSIAFLAMGLVTAKGVRRTGNLALFLGIPIVWAQVHGFIDVWPSKLLLVIVMVSAAALTVGELVARLRDNSPINWDGHALYLVQFLAFVALAQSASLEGSAEAAMDSRDNFSHRELIEFGDPSGTVWRLVDVRADVALVTNSPALAESRQFRLIKLDSSVRIHAAR